MVDTYTEDYISRVINNTFLEHIRNDIRGRFRLEPQVEGEWDLSYNTPSPETKTIVEITIETVL